MKHAGTMLPGLAPRIADSFSAEERIVLFCGDCMDLLRTVPDGAIRLIITSPPYNLGKAYEKVAPLDAYVEGMSPILDELTRVLAEDGSLCWQVGNHVEDGEICPLDVVFYPAFKRRGLHLRNRIIWHFEHGLHARRRFSGRYEVLLWFTKSHSYVFNLDNVRIPAKYPGKAHFKGPKRGLPSGNPLGKNPSDFWPVVLQDWEREVWDIPNVKSNHPEKTVHPCQFPIEMVQRCVLALTAEDDWVLDPFVGVGSSMLAALLHNRRALGCEKEQSYVALAAQRIADLYAGRLRIRPLGKKVYEPTGREKVSRVPALWTSPRGEERS